MRVAFFLGRIHHAIKLLPLAVAMNNRGYEIQFLISDNSINIDPSTAYFNQFGIRGVHHTKDYLTPAGISSAEALVNNALWTGQFDFLPFNSPFWLVSSIRDATYDLHSFDAYLAMQKPDIVFGLHENNFWVKMLFYVAQKHGIKTCSLMEGIIL